MKSKFYTYFDRPPKVEDTIDERNPSLTEAQYADDCDINNLIKRSLAGDPSVLRRGGTFADVSAIGDYQSCLETVRAANEQFDSLPATIRSRFGYDPAAFVDFVIDPNNADELVKLGLAVERKPEVLPVPAVPPVTAEGGVGSSAAEGCAS